MPPEAAKTNLYLHATVTHYIKNGSFLLCPTTFLFSSPHRLGLWLLVFSGAPPLPVAPVDRRASSSLRCPSCPLPQSCLLLPPSIMPPPPSTARCASSSRHPGRPSRLLLPPLPVVPSPSVVPPPPSVHHASFSLPARCAPPSNVPPPSVCHASSSLRCPSLPSIRPSHLLFPPPLVTPPPSAVPPPLCLPRLLLLPPASASKDVLSIVKTWFLELGTISYPNTTKNPHQSCFTLEFSTRVALR
jgi:hypothetical protein